MGFFLGPHVSRVDDFMADLSNREMIVLGVIVVIVGVAALFGVLALILMLFIALWDAAKKVERAMPFWLGSVLLYGIPAGLAGLVAYYLYGSTTVLVISLAALAVGLITLLIGLAG